MCACKHSRSKSERSLKLIDLDFEEYVIPHIKQNMRNEYLLGQLMSVLYLYL